MAPVAVSFLVAAAVWPVGAPPRTRADACRPLALEERVAQTIMTGIPGTALTAATERLVSAHAGSVLLLLRNVSDAAQVRRLTADLHRTGRVRTLVAIDEEGGRISRLAAAGIIEPLPPPRTVAATETTDETRRMGADLGRDLAGLGVDWDLAPVLDVTDSPASTVIGDRSYSGEPEAVAAYGRAFAEGLASSGVLTTGKHFPGEGRTSVDPHEAVATVEASLTELRADLHPFVHAGPALDAVMAAHVLYPALEQELPASLSPAAARLLREEVGFRGVLMTDALEMGAIAARWTIPEAAELALVAGADVVLVGRWSRTRAVARRILSAVRSGRVDADRLDEAAGRVLALKGYAPEEVSCLLSRRRLPAAGR